MKQNNRPEKRTLGFKTFREWIILLLLLVIIFLTGSYNYLLFHSLAEIFGIAIAATAFLIIWNARRFQDNSYLIFIGVAFLFVSIFSVLHLLSFKGMGVFNWSEPTNLPTQLWITSRYMIALSFLSACFFIKPKFHANWVFSIYFIVTILTMLSIFYWRNFPECYQEGVGLTSFKIISEYVIVGILATSIGLLFKNRREFDHRVFNYLIAVLVLMIATEIAFTQYISVIGNTNMIGHLLMIISFYLLYKAIIETGLTRPYSLLFRNLKKSEIRLEQRAAELSEINTRLVAERGEKDRVENELKTYRRQLEQLVEQRTVELTESNRQLENEIAQRARAEEELRTLSNRNMEMLEEERRTISRELHDETGQSLTVLNLLLASFKRLAAEGENIPLAEITQSQQVVKEIMQQVRTLSTNLHPGMLDDIGLLPTLNWYLSEFGKRTGIEITFEYEGEEKNLTPKTRLTTYRIIQESLTNITRYADVKKAVLKINFTADTLQIQIEDTGKGFNISQVATTSTGIRGMRERAMSAGGSLEITSTTGQGTRVKVVLPL